MLFEVNSKLKEDPTGSKKTVKQWAIMSNHHCPRPECASACSLDTTKSFINDSLEIIHQNLILMKCFGIPMKHGKFHGIVMGYKPFTNWYQLDFFDFFHQSQ